MIMGRVLLWAWKNGLDVTVSSRQFGYEYDSIRHPLLRFTRGDRHLEITGRDWDEVSIILEQQHKRIFSDLACKPYKDER